MLYDIDVYQNYESACVGNMRRKNTISWRRQCVRDVLVSVLHLHKPPPFLRFFYFFFPFLLLANSFSDLVSKNATIVRHVSVLRESPEAYVYKLPSFCIDEIQHAQ